MRWPQKLSASEDLYRPSHARFSVFETLLNRLVILIANTGGFCNR
jgi:hypothetical protein